MRARALLGMPVAVTRKEGTVVTTPLAPPHDGPMAKRLVTELTLPLVGQPGAPGDVHFGGDVDPAAGRLLSVAELQLALGAARSGRLAAPASGSGPAAPMSTLPIPASHIPPAALPADVIAVVAAHGGAGGSTTALAIATAAAAANCPVQLIEWCPLHRSGLVAVTTSELGLEDGGCWRRGGRGNGIVVYRRGEVEAADWPTPPNPACLRLADLGFSDCADSVPVVLVCRATVPGIRQAEHTLSRSQPPLALAAVGPSRWPGQVVASAGPHVRRLCEQGRVVTVPLDRRLDIAGLTSGPLPKQVVEAGARLLALLDTSVGRPTAPKRTVLWNHKKGTAK